MTWEWMSVYGITLILGAFMLFTSKPRLLGGKNDRILAIALIGFAVIGGGALSAIEFGTQSAVGSGVASVELSLNNNGTALSIDTLDDSKVNADKLDAQLTEALVMNVSAVVTRSGSADAAFIPVTCTSVDYSNPSDTTDTAKYNIVVKDAEAKLKCYVCDSTGAACEQEKGTIGFTEGDSAVTVTLKFLASEGGHDKTPIYGNRYVNYNIGGTPIQFEVGRLDAAS